MCVCVCVFLCVCGERGIWYGLTRRSSWAAEILFKEMMPVVVVWWGDAAVVPTCRDGTWGTPCLAKSMTWHLELLQGCSQPHFNLTSSIALSFLDL